MKIAFYAPMKSPRHPRPSGDRRIGRLLIEALERVGYEVEIASHLRAWEGRGDVDQQREIREDGRAETDRLIARYRRLPAAERPAAWFTYHLYHKAPDWIGPRVAAALDIPYLVAEASHAPKRKGGPWDMGYLAVEEALQGADAVIALNPVDLGMLQSLPVVAERLHHLRPFLNQAPLQRDIEGSDRKQVAVRYGLNEEAPWLLAVGMMREDSKLESYRVLARAAEALETDRWQLLLVGDGPAEKQVRAAFAGIATGKVHLTGLLPGQEVHALMVAADLFVWPAINEAFGMAILEAQACGLPVVAGDSGGVAEIVRDGVTGMLVGPHDHIALAGAVDALLGDRKRLESMAAAAREKFQRDHRIESAAAELGAIIRGTMDQVG